MNRLTEYENPVNMRRVARNYDQQRDNDYEM